MSSDKRYKSREKKSDKKTLSNKTGSSGQSSRFSSLRALGLAAAAAAAGLQNRTSKKGSAGRVSAPRALDGDDSPYDSYYDDTSLSDSSTSRAAVVAVSAIPGVPARSSETRRRQRETSARQIYKDDLLLSPRINQSDKVKSGLVEGAASLPKKSSERRLPRRVYFSEDSDDENVYRIRRSPLAGDNASGATAANVLAPSSNIASEKRRARRHDGAAEMLYHEGKPRDRSPPRKETAAKETQPGLAVHGALGTAAIAALYEAKKARDHRESKSKPEESSSSQRQIQSKSTTDEKKRIANALDVIFRSTIAGRSFLAQASSSSASATQPRQGDSNGKLATPSTPGQQDRLDLSSTLPFQPHQSSPDGLNTPGNLASSLPFDFPQTESSSNHPPPAKHLQLPRPPKPPTTPDLTKLNQAIWNQYIESMSKYMDTWAIFESRILEHFLARRKQINLTMYRNWMSATGDGAPAESFGAYVPGNESLFMKDQGKDKADDIDGIGSDNGSMTKAGYLTYTQWLEQDRVCRSWWEVACEEHAQSVAGLGRVRNQVKLMRQDII